MNEESNPGTRERLLRLAEALGDGRKVDWDRETAEIREGGDTLRRLRLLESVIAAHRALDAPRETAPAPAPAARPGPLLRWHGLEVGEKTGQTLFGEVFTARVSDREAPVTLVLRRADWPTPERHDRLFAEELRLLMGLDRPSLHRPLGWGKDRGRLGYWTLPVEGTLLAEILVTRGRLPLAGIAALGASLADALEALHGLGLSDRSLDPGRVVLLENGAARYLEGGRLLEAPPGADLDPLAPQIDPHSPRAVEGRGGDLHRLARLLARAAVGSDPPPEGDLAAWDLLPSPLRGPLASGALAALALEPDAGRRFGDALRRSLAAG